METKYNDEHHYTISHMGNYIIIDVQPIHQTKIIITNIHLASNPTPDQLFITLIRKFP